MEKILLSLKAEEVNMQAVEFACYIAKSTNSTITGVFLENELVEDVPVRKSLHGYPFVETIVASDLPGYEEKQKKYSGNIKLFEEACTNRGVRYEVTAKKMIPSKEIIDESRFADLLILSAETSFEEKFEGTPTHFAKEVLAEAECPVLLAPLGFEGIDEIVFAYNATRSSVFAMKQFTYLFPKLENKKINVLQVSDDADLTVAEKEKIKGLLKAHYSQIGFTVLEGKAKDELFGYLLNKKNALVVMGAYGRNMLSGFFKHSTAELVVKAINLPLFIAHH